MGKIAELIGKTLERDLHGKRKILKDTISIPDILQVQASLEADPKLCLDKTFVWELGIKLDPPFSISLNCRFANKTLKQVGVGPLNGPLILLIKSAKSQYPEDEEIKALEIPEPRYAKPKSDYKGPASMESAPAFIEPYFSEKEALKTLLEILFKFRRVVNGSQDVELEKSPFPHSHLSVVKRSESLELKCLSADGRFYYRTYYEVLDKTTRFFIITPSDFDKMRNGLSALPEVTEELNDEFLVFANTICPLQMSELHKQILADLGKIGKIIEEDIQELRAFIQRLFDNEIELARAKALKEDELNLLTLKSLIKEYQEEELKATKGLSPTSLSWVIEKSE